MLFGDWLGNFCSSKFFMFMFMLWGLCRLAKKVASDGAVKSAATKGIISYIFRKLK